MNWRSDDARRRHRRGMPLRARGYGLRLGSTARWAFGQEMPDPAIVRALFPSLSPMGQVHCVRPSQKTKSRVLTRDENGAPLP
jgi:hypothetical protein